MIRARNSIYNNNNEDDNENMFYERFAQSSAESTTITTTSDNVDNNADDDDAGGRSVAASTISLNRAEQWNVPTTAATLHEHYKHHNNNHHHDHYGRQNKSVAEALVAAAPAAVIYTASFEEQQRSAQYPFTFNAQKNFAAKQTGLRTTKTTTAAAAATITHQNQRNTNVLLVKPQVKKHVGLITSNSINDHRPTSPPPAYTSRKTPWKIRRICANPRYWFRRRQTNLQPVIKRNDFDDIITRKVTIVDKGRQFVDEFLQGSSIHGFIYLAKIGLSIVERMLWFAFICVALFSIISLSKRTWERFQTSPMVISMDRNKLVWNTSFPSLTVCPHKRIDEVKVDDYMEDYPDEFQSEEDKEDFRDFIEKLASLTYENIETLPINRTFGIRGEQYLDLLYKLKWNFEPEMSSGAAVQMYIYETLTEFGICHSVNSLVARYNSYEYWKNNEWNLLEHGDRVTVHPLDGEIYAQIINLSTAYDVYFHGSGDIPNISKQRYTFPESDYTTVELIALEIYTAEEARAFTTKQRKCRYHYEAEEILSAPIYSFGLCLAECRMFFALKICGCVPHFYRNRLKNGRTLPVCGFQGLKCLQDIKGEIISLKSDRYKIDCKCLANCDDSNFFVQSYRSRVWFLGANLQWGIIDYPKMQLRRDVLFSFADVLVYIGGLVGFFLGCSALSLTEVFYFLTARFIKRMFC